MPVKRRNMIDADDPRVSKFGHPAPPWLINYADLMTELVCFFIILYALSAALSKNMVNAKEKLDEMLVRENRTELAQKCFDFLDSRCTLDLMAGDNYDIFSHGA